MGVQEGLTRGAAGAAAGAPLGPYGALAVGALGLVSGLFDDSEDNRKAAAAKLQKLMRDAAGTYEGYGPVSVQSKMAGLGNQLSAYQGTNNALTTLYGPENGLVDTAHNLMRPPLDYTTEEAQDSSRKAANAQHGADVGSTMAAQGGSSANASRNEAIANGWVPPPPPVPYDPSTAAAQGGSAAAAGAKEYADRAALLAAVRGLAQGGRGTFMPTAPMPMVPRGSAT